VLILTEAETEALLDPDELRQAVAAAMAELSAGRASMPARIAARVDSRDALVAAMPAYLPSLPGLAVKLVSLFPTNAGTAVPTHQAVVVVFDPDTGTPVALIDGTSITAARTAAGSALATDLLARPESRVLAVLGTGVQARSHLAAVTRVREFSEIRVAGQLALPVVAVDNYAEACDGADVICATTHTLEPVVLREYVADGAHVNSVGYNTAGREVDSQTVADAILVVESRDAVLAAPPSGSPDIRVPIEEGLITANHIHAEIGELVAGTPGRTSADQITLYKSVGVAVQDVAAATMVLRRALAENAGTAIDL
jgi:ornithine cyclodeaminase